MTDEKKANGYNDIYFRIIVALIAAHIVVAFGAKETFFALLVSWFYYRSLSLSFVIAFLLVNEVYWITVKLDRRFDWKHSTIQRVGLQIALGLTLPALTAFLLATVYFGLFGYNIFNTFYLQFDYPVIVIMILLLNVYYIAFYFYRQLENAEVRFLNNKISHKEEQQKDKEIFVVQKGAKNIPLAIEAVSYFYHDGDYNFVRTFEREDFLISQALDEVQKQLSHKQFFRANRQILVNFNACQHFEPLEFGKLELIVSPTTKEPVVISQKRAKAFKEWISR